MRLISLVLINMKRQLKNFMIVLFTFIFPTVMLIVLHGGFFNNSSSTEIGIINNSNSTLSKELVNKIDEQYDIVKLKGKVEDSYNLLRDSKIGVIYVIDQDFDKVINAGKVPEIKSYKKEESNGLIMANNIVSEFITETLENDISEGVSNNSIKAIIEIKPSLSKDDYKMTVLMICYFMMIGGSIITGDLLKLKQQKVLRRTIATNNSDMEILGGLFISTFIIQGILSSLSFLVVVNILNIPNVNLVKGVLVIFLTSILSTAIVVAVTRWIKNPTLASLTTVILGLITFVLGIVGSQLDEFENVPEVMGRISIISPFTWFIKIIDGRGLWIPILIVLLMAGVLFTAGSFRLREYVKE